MGNPGSSSLYGKTGGITALQEAAFGLSALQRDALEKLPARLDDLKQHSSNNQYNSSESRLLSLKDVRLPLLTGQKRGTWLQQTIAEMIGALYQPTQALIYLIQGNQGQVQVSFGAIPLARQYDGHSVPELTEGTVRACLPGSKMEIYQGDSKFRQDRPVNELLRPLHDLQSWGVLTGIPTLGLMGSEQQVFLPDQILHGMHQDQFAYLVVAQPVRRDHIGLALEEAIGQIAYIHPKIRAQLGITQTASETITTPLEGARRSDFQFGELAGAVALSAVSPMAAFMLIDKMVDLKNNDKYQSTRAISTSEAFSEGRESLNQAALYYEQALAYHAQRLLLARNQGLWQANVYLAANSPQSFYKLAGLTRMTFSQRPTAHQLNWNEPIRTLRHNPTRQVGQKLSLITLPTSQVGSSQYSSQQNYHPLPSLYPYALTTPLLTDELAALMNLPQEEYPGYRVREASKFSVYIENDPPKNEPAIEIGAVCDRGETLSGVPMRVPLEALTGHTLIAGVTGGGKTTTCQSLLLQLAEQDVPFLVIEPAKNEYRALFSALKSKSGLQVFTLGNENTSPFRMNPFEILPGVNVQAHIDLLKALISTAFTMWGPLPQMIEWALIHTYKAKGWDLVRGINPYDPKGEISALTPTLDDFYDNLQKAADHFGYSGEVGTNIRAALLARVDSLRRGAKGLMLNTPTSISMKSLLQRPTVLELKDVGDDGDKAFIIGLMLIRLYEWLEVQHSHSPKSGLNHVLVIEEAHRLFRSAGPAVASEDGADPRAKAVETFSNIMSEIRAYGEGVVILDQIPTRLAPDAIKNTNIRVIHRLVSRDDRDYIGLSVNLAEDELDFLTGLPRGEVIFHRDGMVRPSHLRIIPKVQGTIPPQNQQVQRWMAEFLKEDMDYLWRHPGCRHCRRPCTFLTRAENIAENDPGKQLRLLSRMLVLVILVGSSDRASAALGFILGRFKGWLEQAAISVSEDEGLDILWCLLSDMVTDSAFISVTGLINAQYAKSLQENLMETLALLFVMRRSRRFSGDLNKAYREQRENLLSKIRDHYKGQGGLKDQADTLYSPLANKTTSLSLAVGQDGKIIEDMEAQMAWVQQQAQTLWWHEGGQEAQMHRLLLSHEIQQALHDLAKNILWHRLVASSDLGVLDKNKVFELAVADYLS